MKIIKDLDHFKEELKANSINKIKENETEKDLIINPIHSSLNIKELLHEINRSIDDETDLNDEYFEILNQYEIINHHQATELVLLREKKNYEINEQINEDLEKIYEPLKSQELKEKQVQHSS